MLPNAVSRLSRVMSTSQHALHSRIADLETALAAAQLHNAASERAHHEATEQNRELGAQLLCVSFALSRTPLAR